MTSPGSRRLLVACLSVAVLGSCVREDIAQPPNVDRAVTTSPHAGHPSSAPAKRSEAAKWRPGPGEPLPGLKRAAARLLETIGTYGVGEGSVRAAKARLNSSDMDPRLAAEARDLLLPGSRSLAQVIYPQLAGLQGADGAVMVVLRQRLRTGSSQQIVTRTIDVRLTRERTGWVPTSVVSSGVSPTPDHEAASRLGRAVLRDERIELPDSARRDVVRGAIDPRILHVLLRISRDHELGVTVLATGHPARVFGTAYVSNHTAGRAVDVWSVDGKAVASEVGSDGAAHALVEWLYAAGVPELGSPWDLDGPGGRSFTDAVHLDHIHIGFDG